MPKINARFAFKELFRADTAQDLRRNIQRKARGLSPISAPLAGGPLHQNRRNQNGLNAGFGILYLREQTIHGGFHDLFRLMVYRA